MSIDFQVLKPQNAITLSSIRVLPGVNPMTIDVLGEDFSSLDEVQINGFTSPSVVVLSPTRLLAQVPQGVFDEIRSVTVLSNQMTLTESSLLRFRIGRQSTKVNGLLRLLQLFVKILLTTPGRDIFSKNLGGGAMKKLGKTISRDADTGAGIVSDFHLAVEQTKRQITALQAPNPRIPLEERLLNAKILSVRFNRAEGALVASIEVTNHTGRSALAGLTL